MLLRASPLGKDPSNLMLCYEVEKGLGGGEVAPLEQNLRCNAAVGRWRQTLKVQPPGLALPPEKVMCVAYFLGRMTPLRYISHLSRDCILLSLEINMPQCVEWQLLRKMS